MISDLPDEVAEIYLTQTSFERQVWQLFLDGASRTGVDYVKITEDKLSENRVYTPDARLIIATRINAKARSIEPTPQYQYSTKTEG